MNQNQCNCWQCSGKLPPEPKPILSDEMLQAVEDAKGKLTVAERLALVADELQTRGGLARYVNELNDIYETIDDLDWKLLKTATKLREMGHEDVAKDLEAISEKLF